MLLLSLETSGKVCSVALHEEGKLIALTEVLIEKSHSSVITKAIEGLLEFSKKTMNELDAVAVSMGPGSFTGLRIGVSTAKGICFAIDKPLIAVNTLQAMALKVSKMVKAELYLPLLDARRMEVYAALFDKDNREVMPATPVVLDSNSLGELIGGKAVAIFGDGSEKAKEYLKEGTFSFISGVYPSATEVGEIGSAKFAKGQFENLAYFEPFYLKDFYTTSTHGK